MTAIKPAVRLFIGPSVVYAPRSWRRPKRILDRSGQLFRVIRSYEESLARPQDQLDAASAAHRQSMARRPIAPTPSQVLAERTIGASDTGFDLSQENPTLYERSQMDDQLARM